MQAVDRQKGELQFLVLVYSERLQYYEACSYKQLTRLEKKKEQEVISHTFPVVKE